MVLRELVIVVRGIFVGNHDTIFGLLPPWLQVDDLVRKDLTTSCLLDDPKVVLFVLGRRPSSESIPTYHLRFSASLRVIAECLGARVGVLAELGLSEVVGVTVDDFSSWIDGRWVDDHEIVADLDGAAKFFWTFLPTCLGSTEEADAVPAVRLKLRRSKAGRSF